MELLRADSPWTCPQKRVDRLTDDEMLLRSFQSILNKIAPQNFQVLAEKALWLDINTEKRLSDCVEKILKTVSAVPNFLFLAYKSIAAWRVESTVKLPQ